MLKAGRIKQVFSAGPGNAENLLEKSRAGYLDIVNKFSCECNNISCTSALIDVTAVNGSTSERYDASIMISISWREGMGGIHALGRSEEKKGVPDRCACNGLFRA